MECRGKRCRRGRGHAQSCTNISPPCCTSPQHSKPWSFLSSLYSVLIMSSLIGVIYLMLEYHYTTCSSTCDLNNINRSIEDIAKNLAVMKNNYYDLEMKISQYSHELPKMEGQIEILEALATAIETKDMGWEPRSHIALPNVDAFLAANEYGKNGTKCKCPKRLPKVPIVNQN